MTDNLKEIVVKRYSDRISGKSGTSGGSSCCSTSTVLNEGNKSEDSSCSGGSSCSTGNSSDPLEGKLGDISNQSFGCGNPVGLSSVKEGDIVVDLGSGAGLDCIRAASSVGANGKVIGVDLSDEMIAKAKQNVKTMKMENRISFVKGDIENIPLKENSASLVISNCVLALAPDKQKVYNEIYRILENGGRFVISDVVSAVKIPQELRDNMELFSSCTSGASQIDEYLAIIKKSGFRDVEEMERKSYESLNSGGKEIEMYSITVRGYK